MRIDLSREEEIKKIPSESLGLVSMNAFQKKFIERIGCRVQPIKLKDLNCNKSKIKLKWKSILSFKETIRMSVDWYKSYYSNPKKTYETSSNQIRLYEELLKKRF